MAVTYQRIGGRASHRPQTAAGMGVGEGHRGGVSRAYVAAMTVLVVAAGAVRWARIDHPMRYDESYTYLFLARSDDPADWFSYEAPNNHLLNTLAVHATTRVGGMRPAAIRLPALLAGLALLPAAGAFARRLSGRESAGLIAAVLVGASSILVEYSVNARGYSMVELAAVALAALTLELSRRPGRWGLWAGWVCTAVLGSFAIPVMAYPIAICAAVFVVQLYLSNSPRRRRRLALRRLAVALAAAVALTLVLYTPSFLISGVGSVFMNRFVEPKTFALVAKDLPPAAAKAFGHWIRDTSYLWRVVVAAGLLWALAAARKRDAFRALPVIAVPLLALAAVAQRVVPFPRVWLFLLPMSLAVAAAGLADLAAAIAPRRAAWRGVGCVAVLVSAACADAAWQTLNRRHLFHAKSHTLVEAEAIILDAVPLADGRTAVVYDRRVANWPPLMYYAALHWPHPPVEASDDACRRAVVVVDERFTSLEATLEDNDVVRERFAAPGRGRRYGRARAYIVHRKAATTRPTTRPATRGAAF
jgi:hypothetical protein